MENLEERLKSLEELIKTSVAAKISEAKPEERADVLTPSSLQSTTSTAEQFSHLTESSRGNRNSSIDSHVGQTLLQALNSRSLTSSSVVDPTSTDSSSLGGTFNHVDTDSTWSPDIDPQFGLAVPGLASTDVELIPQVRYNGPKKCSLPPIQGGMFLLQEYLVDFNTALPIFDAGTITTMFQRCYDNMASGTPIEWVALKVVLGIAHRLRAMSPLGVPQDTENANTYLQECLETVPELLMLRPSLLLAQCFLGIAIIVSTSSRPYPAQSFVGLAFRVIQDLHINDPKPPHSIDSDDFLQQSRVFWFAFFMDIDMGLRAGRLPSVSPRLINLELPRENQDDSAGDIAAVGGEFKANVFRLHIELALLQAEFMEQVLLPRSQRNSDCPEDAELRSIKSRLDEWRRNWLFELNPQDLRAALHRSDLVHVVVLESTYFTTAFHFLSHISPVSRTQTNPFLAEGLIEGMSRQKGQLLYKDARRFIDLLRLIPGDDIACNW